ncbi:sulfite exporter TauE/SafE family protein [Rhizobium herbae]|uniref:Probable membrane transporter protein n=1 Tax=Rhizobium herbae TaxID=508661 RepID=A0ABS4ESC6_9HYPH|nr:sulfite exporter TauE/SafE family protein [Rhizobium herbae]MBP1860851.1 putative membrane protein YfcA [Rhizobium herbae]
MGDTGFFATLLARVAASLPEHGLYPLLVCTFIAGMARGFSGFGAALILIPIGGSIVGPKIISPVLLVIDTIASAGMLPAAWRAANRREVFTMASGALIGVPLGTAALALADPLILRWAITIVAACLLILLVSGWRYHGQPRAPLTAGVGGIAGVFSGAAQLGGPPVVAYWLSGASDVLVIRSNLMLYFVISSALTAVSYLVGGLFVEQVFALTLIILPLYAGGLYVGSRLFGLAKPSTFRTICYVLIGAAAVLGMPALDTLLR